MGLPAIFKSFTPEMLERAQAHAAEMSEHIRRTNANTEAIATRLAAIDTGLSQIRAILLRLEANQAATTGRLDGVTKALRQFADEGE